MTGLDCRASGRRGSHCPMWANQTIELVALLGGHRSKRPQFCRQSGWGLVSEFGAHPVKAKHVFVD